MAFRALTVMRISAMPVGCALMFLSLLASLEAEVVYDLPKLIADSDVVAIVQVDSTMQTGSGVIQFQSGPIKAHYRLATLVIREVLKGKSDENRIVVPYTLLYADAGWGGGVPPGYTIHDSFVPNSVRMVFLKLTGDRYAVTNGSYLSVVCSPEVPSGQKPSEIEAEVLWWIGGTLFSPSAVSQERAEAIWQLSVVKSPLVAPFLKQFIQSEAAQQEPRLRSEALAALLRQKDDSLLDLAETDLLSAKGGSAKDNLIFAISAGLPPARSIPVLAKVLQSPDAQLRVSAARAIYQTNSAQGIQPLLGALGDPDPEAAFAIMQGLGNLTKQYEWRPKSTNPDADWFRCLNHWNIETGR